MVVWGGVVLCTTLLTGGGVATLAPLLPEALSVPVVRTGLAGGGGKLDEAPAPAPAPPWPPEKPGEVAARLVVVVSMVVWSDKGTQLLTCFSTLSAGKV